MGEPVTVEYSDGTTETEELCENCRESFIDAELVADMLLPGSEDDLKTDE